MTPRSLFNIIIKIFGLFFLKDIVISIPQLFSSLLYFIREDSAAEGLWTFTITALILGFYAYLVFKLLFNTNYVLDKLKLDQGFDENEFSLNISTSLVLMIALVVTGGIILADEIPNLCRQLFAYFQERRLMHGMANTDFSYSVLAFVKIILGLLLIGERKRIVAFVESRQNNNAAE